MMSRRAKMGFGIGAVAATLGVVFIFLWRYSYTDVANPSDILGATPAAAWPPPAPKRSRTLTFPKNVSIGTVSARAWGSDRAWEAVGLAQGKVIIPGGMEAGLSVRPPTTGGTTAIRVVRMNISPPQAEGAGAAPSTSAASETEPSSGTLRGMIMDPDTNYTVIIGQERETREQRRILSDAQGRLVLPQNATQLLITQRVATRTIVARTISLKPLAALPHNALQTLNLSETRVTDLDLAHIEGLTSLWRLSLRGTRITDRGLRSLAGMTSLRLLDLSETSVGDSGMAALRRMTDLEFLYLNGTFVSDAGLYYLNGLSSLKRLRLSASGVTAEGVELLREKLPDCLIEWSEGGQSEGLPEQEGIYVGRAPRG